MPGHLRARGHQHGDRDRLGLRRLHPHRRAHRPGADPSHRQRRLPGSGHRRHHALLHQAQLPRRVDRRPGPDPQGGLLPRPLGPARAGARRHPEKHRQRQNRLHAPRGGAPALVQPDLPAEPEATARSGPASPGGRAPADLCRRGGDSLQGCGRADPPGAGGSHPRHDLADGPGRVPGLGSALSRDDRNARHLRGQHECIDLRPHAGRRRALRRPRDRENRCVRAPGRHRAHRHRPDLDPQEHPGQRTPRRRLPHQPADVERDDRGTLPAVRPALHAASGSAGSRNGSRPSRCRIIRGSPSSPSRSSKKCTS